MSSKLKITMPCDEANHVCDKTQYKEATLWEKIKLNIHLLYCRACRKYTTNNAKLTKKIKESKVECLDKKCKESMKKELDHAINEQSA
jgi:chorismate synthase